MAWACASVCHAKEKGNNRKRNSLVKSERVFIPFHFLLSRLLMLDYEETERENEWVAMIAMNWPYGQKLQNYHPLFFIVHLSLLSCREKKTVRFCWTTLGMTTRFLPLYILEFLHFLLFSNDFIQIFCWTIIVEIQKKHNIFGCWVLGIGMKQYQDHSHIRTFLSAEKTRIGAHFASANALFIKHIITRFSLRSFAFIWCTKFLCQIPHIWK